MKQYRKSRDKEEEKKVHLQYRNLVLFMSHEQRQACQSLLQILPQDLHSLRRIHLLVLLILILRYTKILDRKLLHICRNLWHCMFQHVGWKLWKARTRP